MTEERQVKTYERPEWQKNKPLKDCKSCGAKLYFVADGVYPENHKRAGEKRWIPVNAETNQSHFIDCPDAQKHRKER